jgi:hypothetical protein
MVFVKTPNTLDDLFDCWETIPQMAEDVGESPWTVSKWNQRQRIPHDYWPTVIEAARERGIKLTAEILLAMHAPPPSRRPHRDVACK